MHEALLDTPPKNKCFFRFFNASISAEIVTFEIEASQLKANRPLADSLRLLVKTFEHISDLAVVYSTNSTSLNMPRRGRGLTEVEGGAEPL